MIHLILIPAAAGLATFICVGIVYMMVKREDEGTERMREIAGFIREGAWAFLNREMKTISYFIVALSLLLLIVFWPRWQIAFGFILGPWCLAAFLISTTIVGALLATYMFNSGAIYDNAKKYIEDGHFGGKNTPAHHNAVIGDTFGDPLKDTAGPSLHILIKLVSIVSIMLLPLFLAYSLIP